MSNQKRRQTPRGGRPTQRSSSSLPSWDLSALFSSPQDKKISKVQKDALKRADRFRKTHKGNVARLCKSPDKFWDAMAEYSDILQQGSKVARYASMLHSESMTAPGSGAFLQKSQAAYTEMSNKLTFFPLELGEVPAKRITKIKQHEKATSYQNYLAQLVKTRKHRLSEREEQLMSDKALSGTSVWLRLFGELLSEKKFTLRQGRKRREVSEAEALDTLHHVDRNVRKSGAKALSEGFRELSPRLALIYNTIALDKSINDRYRSFDSPEASRHLANEIDQEMVDALVASVSGSYKVVQDYYRFKKKQLRYQTLYDYDRYAPLGKSSTRISFPKAQKLVLDSFDRFDPELRAIAELFFAKRWIDAAKRPGKRSGAYCAFVTPDTHPYVFMNYSGTVRDVFTLAHELGHAVHAYLMRQHPYAVFDVPLTIAETASVFAELLLFEHMKDTMKPGRDLFELYLMKIESIFATVYRQISMFLFERDVHAARKQGELQPEDFNRFWRNRQTELFRSSVTLTEDYDWWWCYIPHFLHTPFYVYSYAFGELLTLALFHRYQEQPEGFAKKYTKLLAAGGTKPPKQLLRPMKIDLGSKQLWDDGVDVVRGLVKEAKALSRRL